MIQLDHPAPDFTAQTTLGEPFQLSKLRGKRVVLYFFPKAFTPGCTREAGTFRDAYEDLQELGAEVVGISTDDHQTQCDFSARTKANFPMIGDPNGEIARKFDVLWPFFKMVRRVTFLIDEEGLIRGVYRHELRTGAHVDDALSALKRLGPLKR